MALPQDTRGRRCLNLAILTRMADAFPADPAGLFATLLGRFAAARAGQRRRAELRTRTWVHRLYGVVNVGPPLKL